MVDNEGDGESAPGGSSSRTVWVVVLAVLVVALLGVIAFLLVRDDDSEQTTTSAPPTTTETVASPPVTDTDTADTAVTSGDDALPPGPECSADALLAASSTISLDLQVVDFGCTPTSLGDVAGGWAWAELSTPDDSITAFYTAYAGDAPEGGATFGAWEMVAFEEVGVELFCDDVMPPEACDGLPGAPRR